MSRPPPDDELLRRLRSRGYTPGQKDLAELFEHLGGERDLARAAERALLRAQHPLCEQIVHRSQSAEPRLRARLTRLAARRAQHEPPGALRAFLLGRLEDDDERTRRGAASGLGRVHEPEIARALVARCEVETSAAVLMEIATALGKIGGEEASTMLACLAQRDEARDDEPLRSAIERASLMCHRSESSSSGEVRLDAAPDGQMSIAVHCRPGLEGVLREELQGMLGGRTHPNIVGSGTVHITLTGPPSRIATCRVMTELGFLIRSRRSGAADAAAFAGLIASDSVWAPLRRWTTGAVRYRLAWSRGGKRRKLRWDVVMQASRLRPSLENAPSQSLWEIRLDETADELIAELVPHYEDSRFAYRQRDVPAASHPTVAAALVRVAEVTSADVVWDPFVGSGLELCEAWLAARPKELVGSDTDPDALSAARVNLESVGAHGVRLLRRDALTLDDVQPTVIVTNPPLGRRVLRGRDVEGTLVAFIRHAAERLVPGGRLTWVSPYPDSTLAAAQEAGLQLAREMRVDLGGIEGTVQRFDKLNATRAPRGSSPRRAS